MLAVVATPNSFSCLMKVQERWREEVGVIKSKCMCETIRLPAAGRFIKVMSLQKNGDLSQGPIEKVGYGSTHWESRVRRTLEIAGQLVLPVW